MAEHIVARLKISILGRQIKMSILSTIDVEAKKELVREQSAEAQFYYEEEDPFRTMSTTELQSRLKDLDDQRRVLVALQELGGADFNLTAEEPLQKGSGPGSHVAQVEQELSPDGSVSDTEGSDETQEVHEFHRMAHTMKLARSLNLTMVVNSDIEVPHGMIADLETYPLWMPWCTSGEMDRSSSTTDDGEQVFNGKVGFGFETRTFLGTVGDTVSYTVTVKQPQAGPGGGPVSGRVLADAVNGFTYGKRLAYDWRFQRIGAQKTKVELDMFFQARSVLYMPVWDSMQHMVVNGMLSAFKERAAKVQLERSKQAKDEAKPASADAEAQPDPPQKRPET
eukprot:TRINITY_DN117958_c0_g1_i1.p1 TRINITY_DN117958_c0_g1~~TRINITY_DN117958_c0_g1_i1.p1  ORF type:complete len:385 (+),score=85.20 TRINITY_DN117958_c0_g1_i1:143-1156(+)